MSKTRPQHYNGHCKTIGPYTVTVKYMTLYMYMIISKVVLYNNITKYTIHIVHVHVAKSYRNNNWYSISKTIYLTVM